MLQVERDRIPMIRHTFRRLDTFFGRRGPSSIPVNVHRLRVSFKDEPGEGSGVVRSFYTAIGEALLVEENLPELDTIFTSTNKGKYQEKYIFLFTICFCCWKMVCATKMRMSQYRNFRGQIYIPPIFQNGFNKNVLKDLSAQCIFYMKNS